MNTFHLEILSPQRPVYQGACISLVVPLNDGQIGIQAGHSRMIAAIVPGEVSFTLPDGETRYAAVSSGMVNVSGDFVRVLTDTALFPDEIDEEREQRDAETAREELRRKQSIRDYRLSQLTFARAINNLRVKKHQNNDIK